MENKLEKILLCVEDVNLDDHIIEYTHMIAKAVGLKSVYLLHVIHDIPHETFLAGVSEIEGTSMLAADERYRDEIKRLTTGYHDAMTKAAAKHFGELKNITQHVDVRVGNQLRDTLTIAHEEDIDLIVMGRHLGARLSPGDTAVLPRRITRKATCSVLVIPEDFTPRLSNILCPVRDSKCSTLALQTAVDLGTAFDADVHAINLFHLYEELHYPGPAMGPMPTHEERLNSAQRCAIKENELLLAKVKQGSARLHFDYHVEQAARPSDFFETRAEELGCDLIVIGARGRTGAAGVLLGSITEHLVKKCKVPLLATKEKGEQIGVLKALLTLLGKE